MTTVAKRTRVLCIGGLGRSGSTIVGMLLGQLPGHCAVGELSHLWHKSALSGFECGCGRPFQDCPFWSEVGEVAFGGWGRVDLGETLRLQRSVARVRSVPLLIASRAFPGFRRKLVRYLDVLTPVYRAVEQVSGAHVVVDTSKYAGHLYLLRLAKGLDVRVVHVVRDPRGVAYSFGKTVKRPERPGVQPQYMPRWSAPLVCGRWLLANLLVEGLRRLGVPVVSLRYEDFVEDPAGSLQRVTEVWKDDAVGGDSADFVRGREALLRPSHTADGNPMRFQTGWVAIRGDEAWRSALDPSRRRVVELGTWPLRRRYGYQSDGVAQPPTAGARGE